MNEILELSREDNRAHNALAEWSRTVAARIRRPAVQRSYIVPMVSKALHIIAIIQACEGAYRTE